MLSEGSLSIFVQRPLSAILLLLVVASLLLPLMGLITRRRAQRRLRNETPISIATK
jgi:putative tricarboxylic transport membrane protein